jgi:uncharacterized protein YqjF (DUF2071 family)
LVEQTFTALNLKSHPFAVEAFFDRSTVLTYAAPPDALQSLLPPCLKLDTYRAADGREWAFVAVAMVQTRHLRPKGFPRWMGNDFFLIGYRLFVTYTTSAGKRLRGLYILKSETDKHKMTLLGNVFTHYNYAHIDIRQEQAGGTYLITSQQADLDVAYSIPPPDALPLPTGSPFPDWKTARRYAGPLPFTFSYNPTRQEVLIIEGVREHWQPHPIAVARQRVGFLDTLGLTNPLLASAFTVEQIPYSWKKGRTDLWTP